MRVLSIIVVCTVFAGCSCQSEQGLADNLDIVEDAPPAVEVDPLLIDYGIQLGVVAVPEFVTVTNVGGGQLLIQSLELIAPEGVWQIGDSVDPELGPGQSTTFNVTFVHLGPIDAAGMVVVHTDAPTNGDIEVELIVAAPGDSTSETGDTGTSETADTGAETGDTGTSETGDTAEIIDTGPDPCAPCDPLSIPFGAGSGVALDPWQICAYPHLDNVRNYGADDFLLCGDLDLTGQALQPIPLLSGDFDGGGYALQNWSFTDQNAITGTNLAMFVEVSGTLHDLTIDNASLTIYNVAAILVRRLLTGGTVSRVTIVNSAVNALDGHIAGAIVTVDVGALVEDLHFSGDVTTVGTGGFVGGLIDSCQGVCTRMLAEGTVSSNGWKTAGLVQSSSGGLVSSSISRMTVNGTNRVGGLMGVMNGGVIEDCYFEGTVNGTFWVSGILAETWNTPNPEIRRSYASGAVNPTQQANGIAGAGVLAWDATNAIITDSGWDTQTTGVVYSDGGQSMQTAGMQDPAHPLFATWGPPWILVAGDYPRLDWE